MTVKALSTDVIVRMPYWKDPDYPGIDFDPEEGLTKQSFKDECDINNIMTRFNATGVVSHVSSIMPEYGDFMSAGDFQSSLNTVIEAQALFDALPAVLRDRFGNDPKQLLAFIADENNREEAVKLGLVKEPDPEPAPTRVHVVKDDNPPPPQPKAP